MKLTYTGKQGNLTPQQQRKIDGHVAKLSKVLLERGRGEKEAHIVLTAERHLQKAEVTVNFFDHALVAIGTGTDQFNAMLDALEKLEKRSLKLRERWRDTRRTGDHKSAETAAPPARAAKPPKVGRPAKVIRQHTNGKPMTVEEALLDFGEDQDYLVFRDTDTERTTVIVRRRDGKLDLIQP